MRFDSNEMGLLLLTSADLTPEKVLSRDAFSNYLDSVIDPIHAFWDPSIFPEGEELRTGLADPNYVKKVIDDFKGRVRTGI